MKKILKIIVYAGVIISLIPIITMFCINLKQDEIETDRNFYGKEITEDQLKVVKNTYQKYECNSKYIVKKKELGKMKYFYHDKNQIRFEASEEEYNRYIKDSDIFYVYKSKCQLSYYSNRGKLTVKFTGKKISLMPKTFSDQDLRTVKNLVVQKSHKKVFSTYSFDDVTKKYNNLAIYGLENKKAITDFKFSNELGKGSVCGRSLIKSAKYDRLYKDFAFYQTPKEKLTNTKDRFLLFCAKLQPCYPGGYFLVYMFSFLSSQLLVLFAGAEDENHNKSVLIIILQYVVTGLWMDQWNKSGIVMAIILILILLCFIGKELKTIRKEGDLQDEEKKNI